MSSRTNIEKQVAHKGCIIKIYRDDDSESPREWDNLGTIYSNHRRWNPDGKEIGDLMEMAGQSRYDSQIDFDRIAKDFYFLKVWMYDHSGQTIRVADANPWGNMGYMSWDSGLCGVIAVSKEKAKEEYSYKRACKGLEKRALKCLTGEIETLNQFMQGDVWGYVVEDEDGNEIDSCWGYYAIEDAIADAKGTIDYQEEKKVTK